MYHPGLEQAMTDFISAASMHKSTVRKQSIQCNFDVLKTSRYFFHFVFPDFLQLLDKQLIFKHLIELILLQTTVLKLFVLKFFFEIIFIE